MKHVMVFLMFWCYAGFAQFASKENADFTIRGNFCIPKPITSDMYRTSFDGIYEANLSLNMKVAGHFYAGIGYQNVLFENDKSFKYSYYNASIPYNTRLMGNGVYARFDYIRFFSGIGYMSYALQGGYMLSHYYNVNADTSKANKPYGATKFNAPFLQPEVSVNFIVDKTLSFSVVLSYTTLFSHFDPKAPRFNQFEQISGASNKYVMSWINFGFGFNVLLNKK